MNIHQHARQHANQVPIKMVPKKFTYSSVCKLGGISVVGESPRGPNLGRQISYQTIRKN